MLMAIPSPWTWAVSLLSKALTQGAWREARVREKFQNWNTTSCTMASRTGKQKPCTKEPRPTVSVAPVPSHSVQLQQCTPGLKHLEKWGLWFKTRRVRLIFSWRYRDHLGWNSRLRQLGHHSVVSKWESGNARPRRTPGSKNKIWTRRDSYIPNRTEEKANPHSDMNKWMESERNGPNDRKKIGIFSNG